MELVKIEITEINLLNCVCSEVVNGVEVQQNRMHSHQTVLTGNEPELVTTFLAALPMLEPEHCEDGTLEVVDSIVYDVRNPYELAYRVRTSVHFGSTCLSSKADNVALNCLDDLSEHPEKVQKVAAIVFTDEVKAKAQAEIDAKCCQKMVSIPTGEVEEYEEEETYIDISDGKAVQRTRTVTKKRPVMQEVGVVDEYGNPVMEMRH